MLENIRSFFGFGNLPAASAHMNNACRCFAAAVCSSALFCLTQTAIAEPEAAESAPPQTKAVQTVAVQTPNAYTGRVRAEGIATIGTDGRSTARHAALANALRKASASAGAPAMKDKLPEVTNAPRQNFEARPGQPGNRYSILREWENQGLYHITIGAEVVMGKFDAENATLLQLPKKKIVFIQFNVANTIHVDDINNIYDGFPAALSSRLEASGGFLSAYSSRSIPNATEATQREAIIQIAKENGAQFLISGMVINAGISQKTRHIEVELSVYDGFTGTRLLLRRLDEQARGDVMVGNNKPFGSSIFFETAFGKATSRLIDSAVNDLQEALENVPFSAHIIRVAGKSVFLDAGEDALLKPGDQFVAYASDVRTPVTGLNGLALGTTERAADTITLTQIKPQFSIGELPEDAAKLGIKVGNIARINFSDLRDLAAKQLAAQQQAKAQQEAKIKTEHLKAEQAAQAEAARIKAIQIAQAEAARIKAEQKAKAKAAAEAKAAKLKVQQATKSSRLSAAQQARARALAVRIKAQQKAQAAAEAKMSKSKDEPETKTEAAQTSAKPSTPIPKQ